MPFFCRKTLISRELWKRAANGFHLCKLGSRRFHQGLFRTTSRTVPLEGGASNVKSRGFKNADPAKLVPPPHSPLLKKKPEFERNGRNCSRYLFTRNSWPSYWFLFSKLRIWPRKFKKSEFLQIFGQFSKFNSINHP